MDHRTPAAAQENDNGLSDIVNFGMSALRLKKIRFPDHDVGIYCDVSGDIVRPYVPKSLRRGVFNSLHGLSHPGIRATQNLVTTRFVWLFINKDSRNWTRPCIPCQQCKVTRHVSSPVGTFGKLAGLDSRPNRRSRLIRAHSHRHYRDAIFTRLPILSNMYRVCNICNICL